MRQGIFITILMIVAFIIAYFIFTYMLPDYLRQGGPLVIVLIMLSIMVVTFVFERLFVLGAAKGKGSLHTFLKNIKKEIDDENIDGAIEICNKQRGSFANVLRAGLEKYNLIKKSDKNPSTAKEKMEEIKRAIDEAMMLEVPLLERNLVALSTIASIATLVGLLGTTIGMIRAFRALAHAGAPDAIMLSVGISEALVNTAGGLLCAIMGIVFYNYFVTRIDNFTYMIDEASLAMLETLTK
jgi:biopolymer transport protein ExbB